MDRHTVVTEAYIGHTGEWLYEGFTAWQWQSIADEQHQRGQDGAADEAYAIAGWLQALDDEAN